MTDYEHVLIGMEGAIGTITLSRPEKLNAFHQAMCRDLLEAVRMLAGSASVRVIVITGAGRAFSAGADLAVLGNGGGPALVRAGRDIAIEIREAPKPVLAAVNGPAAGGGANLALACDYRIASDRASIGQVFHRLGLGPDWGGSHFLPRLVGTPTALELVWSARMVQAQEALRIGLFNRVVPDETLSTETRNLADLWAAQPARAVCLAKRAVYSGTDASLEASLDLEIEQQDELFMTADARERIAQELQKRSH